MHKFHPLTVCYMSVVTIPAVSLVCTRQKKAIILIMALGNCLKCLSEKHWHHLFVKFITDTFAKVHQVWETDFWVVFNTNSLLPSVPHLNWKRNMLNDPVKGICTQKHKHLTGTISIRLELSVSQRALPPGVSPYCFRKGYWIELRLWQWLSLLKD